MIAAAAGFSAPASAGDDRTGSPPRRPLRPVVHRTAAGGVLHPADLIYQGAFRLPDTGPRPLTFEYGGNAMTSRPDGDPGGPTDGFPGSLFITGHDRLAYGELPGGGQVAEVDIPRPSLARTLDELPTARFLQPFAEVAAGHFEQLEEIPRIALQYLDHPDTGPLLHLAWGQHLQDASSPSHAWFRPALATGSFAGEWFLGTHHPYVTTGYMLRIPAAWADRHTAGRLIGTGRYRDGGQGGMGPALFAYRPWLPGGGAPAPGTRLAATPLLLYASSLTTENIERCLDGYQHPDEWEGAAWLTTPRGASAVLFAGTKGTGARYWYGYVNPEGAHLPCVHGASVGQFTVCRLADGTPCPASDLVECAGHTSARGWWSSRFDAQLLLYDPDDLAAVAAGTLPAWQPQPYAALDVDRHLFFQPPPWDEETLGRGDQRRMRLGAADFDPDHGLLYVLELFGDGARPVVHVWRVR